MVSGNPVLTSLVLSLEPFHHLLQNYILHQLLLVNAQGVNKVFRQRFLNTVPQGPGLGVSSDVSCCFIQKLTFFLKMFSDHFIGHLARG